MPLAGGGVDLVLADFLELEVLELFAIIADI